MCYNNPMEKKERQIRISESAFQELKKRADEEQFRTRGVTGVVDFLLFGRFTTTGKGRLLGCKNRTRKSDKKDLDNQISA